MGDAGSAARTILRLALLGGTALGAALPASAQSVAPTVLPTGGQVIGGVATIGRSGNALTIDQSTGNAAINWQSFSVGSQASVGFHVPSAQATTINRVVGPDPSVIAGRITSNGNVVIANQSGIVFTHGAEVDVNSLVASAPGISAANAAAGRLVFDQPPRPGAAVVNAGNITLREAGLAALVAPEVANSGVIEAKLGRVVLAGASAAVVDLYGDGLLSLDVTKEVTTAPGGGLALVTNSGTILARGGTVQLTAAAVDGLVTDLVDAGGRIAAGTGSIVIAGTGGNVEISGDLTARGTAAGSTGGRIVANATGNVTVGSGAVLDVSGAAGGGVIAVGTSLARAIGGESVVAPRAQSVTVEAGAALHADALAAGNGGRVAVLASGLTDFAGSISARGGPLGGNGGSAEISGSVLAVTGQINLGAALGQAGSILFDPGNVLIQSGGNGSVSNSETFGVNTTLDPTAIEALSGNVTINATGSIDIESGFASGLGTTIGNVTLQAAGDIILNAQLLAAGNQIVMIAGDPVLGGTAGSILIASLGEILPNVNGYLYVPPSLVALLAENNITINGFISTRQIELLSMTSQATAANSESVFVAGGTISLPGNIPGPIPFPTLPPPPIVAPLCPIGAIACVVPLPSDAMLFASPLMEADASFILPFLLAPPQNDELDITFPSIAREDF